MYDPDSYRSPSSVPGWILAALAKARVPEPERRPVIVSRYPHTYAADYLREHAADFGVPAGVAETREATGRWLLEKLAVTAYSPTHVSVAHTLAGEFIKEHDLLRPYPQLHDREQQVFRAAFEHVPYQFGDSVLLTEDDGTDDGRDLLLVVASIEPDVARSRLGRKVPQNPHEQTFTLTVTDGEGETRTVTVNRDGRGENVRPHKPSRRLGTSPRGQETR